MRRALCESSVSSALNFTLGQPEYLSQKLIRAKPRGEIVADRDHHEFADAVARAQVQQFLADLLRRTDHLAATMEGDAETILAAIGISSGVLNWRNRSELAALEAQPPEITREREPLGLGLG